MELKERFKRFIQSLSKGDRIALLHHSDSDGIASAIVLSKALEKLIGKRPDLVLAQQRNDLFIPDTELERIRQNKTNKFISVDLALDQFPERIKLIEGFSEVLLVDHHKTYADLNSPHTLMVKAQDIFKDIDPSRYPCCKLLFDLLSGLTDLIETDWIVAVGIIGDNGQKTWGKFIKEVNRKYELREGYLGELRKMVDAVEIMQYEKLGEVFKALYNARHPLDLKGSEYFALGKELEKELNCWLKGLKERAEFFEEIELVYYFIKPKYPLKAPLVNKISNELFPNKTVVVVQDLGEKFIEISARRQDFKLAVNDLLEESCKGFKGAVCGGHFPAAGGTIKREDLNRFKENLLRILKEKISA